MTRNLNNHELKTSNYFINYIQYYPNKKAKIKPSTEVKNKLTKIGRDENKKVLITSPPSQHFKSLNKNSSKKDKSNILFSPKTSSKIGYLKQFNNNSIYYSNQKVNKFSKNYKNQNLNTDVKGVIFKNKNTFSKNLKLMNMRRKSIISNNNIIEDSKNNTLNENTKKLSNLIFLNKTNRARMKNNKIKKIKTCTDNDFQCAPKKNLLNIISANNLFEEEINNTTNTSRIINKSVNKNNIIPKIIDPEEFIKINKIGHGSFGKIYKVKWNQNNKNYAMKEMIFQSIDNIIYLKERLKNIVDIQKISKCDGIIRTYGECSVKKKQQYFYYEIMELAERDWEKEINMRKKSSDYYSETVLVNIMTQLVKTLSLLQKNHITHRDIKLQNILIIKNKYKICDFGESRTINQKGTIVQPVRGSELYMSPILFLGLQEKSLTVTHNTYKSDVFSLGMCILFAASLNENCLYEIREMTNMDNIRNVLEYYLSKRYSIVFIEILLYMLEINEKKRPDFIQLEKLISQTEILN